MLRLGDGILSKATHDMMATIRDHLEEEASPAAHERLLHKAQGVNIKPRENMDAYITRLLEIRRDMIRAKYPHIDEESTTVACIVRGLSARPSPAPQIPLLITQRNSTIREFRTLIDLLALCDVHTSSYLLSHRHPRSFKLQFSALHLGYNFN